MNDLTRFKVGLFAVIGMAILFALFFLIGLRSAFEPRLVVSTIFTESVQGLDIGSPVKFRGVTIGTVKRVLIQSDGQGIRVDMDILLSRFDPVIDISNANGTTRFMPSQLYFDRHIDNGLRCQLEILGIATGLKYIEFDYVDSNLLTKDESVPPPNIGSNFFIPAAPSFTSGIKSSATDILIGAQRAITNFNKIDFDEINRTINEMRQTITNIRVQIESKGEQIDVFFREIQVVLANVDSSVKEFDYNRMNGILLDIQDAVRNADSLISETRNEIKHAAIRERSENLNRLICNLDSQLLHLDIAGRADKMQASLDQITEDVSYVTADANEVRRQINVFLKMINAPVLELRSLLKTLERNPSQLIRGRNDVSWPESEIQTK